MSLEIAGGVVLAKILHLVEFWDPPSKNSGWPQRKVTGPANAQNELENRFMMVSEPLEHSFPSKSCHKDCSAASFAPKSESTIHGNLKNCSHREVKANLGL